MMTSGVAHALTVNVAITAPVTNGNSRATCSTVNASNMAIKTVKQCAVVKVTKGIAVCCP